MNRQSPPDLSHIYLYVKTFGCLDRHGDFMLVQNVALVKINSAYTFFYFTLLYYRPITFRK